MDLLTAAQLRAIFPGAEADAWAPPIARAWARFNLSAPNVRAGLLGIWGNETGGFRRFAGRENMNYTAERAAQVWKRARGPDGRPSETCREKVAQGQRAFANWIYGDTLGNRGEASGDGWNYRGNGIGQLTGRSVHVECGDALGLPIADDPDLLARDRDASALSAAWFATAYKPRVIALLATGDESDFLDAAKLWGLPPDPDATERRLLGWRAAMAELGGAAAIPQPALDRGLIRRVQVALNARGAHPPLVVDGIAGPRTAAAIATFRMGAGLPPDGGAIDAALLSALGIV